MTLHPLALRAQPSTVRSTGAWGTVPAARRQGVRPVMTVTTQPRPASMNGAWYPKQLSASLGATVRKGVRPRLGSGSIWGAAAACFAMIMGGGCAAEVSSKRTTYEVQSIDGGRGYRATTDRLTAMALLSRDNKLYFRLHATKCVKAQFAPRSAFDQLQRICRGGKAEMFRYDISPCDEGRRMDVAFLCDVSHLPPRALDQLRVVVDRFGKELQRMCLQASRRRRPQTRPTPRPEPQPTPAPRPEPRRPASDDDGGIAF